MLALAAQEDCRARRPMLRGMPGSTLFLAAVFLQCLVVAKGIATSAPMSSTIGAQCRITTQAAAMNRRPIAPSTTEADNGMIQGEYGPMTMLEANGFYSLLAGTFYPLIAVFASMMNDSVDSVPLLAIDSTCACRTHDHAHDHAHGSHKASSLVGRIIRQSAPAPPTTLPQPRAPPPPPPCSIRRSLSTLDHLDHIALGTAVTALTAASIRASSCRGGFGSAPALDASRTMRSRTGGLSMCSSSSSSSASSSDNGLKGGGGGGGRQQQQQRQQEQDEANQGAGTGAGASAACAVPGMAANNREGKSWLSDYGTYYRPLDALQRSLALAGGGAFAAAARAKGSSVIASGVWLGIGTLISSMFVRELRQRRELQSEEDVRYPDSKFVQAAGLKVHYIEAAPPGNSKPAVTLVCLHGFGASCGSYRPTIRQLSDQLNARVVAVDMPGFGLTERPKRGADYDAIRMLKGVVAELGLGGQGEPPLVVVGHSLGGLVGLNFALESGLGAKGDGEVSAAVLVAPAVVADRGGGGIVEEGSKRRRLLSSLANAFVVYTVQLVLLLLRPFVTLLLRLLVYRVNFWRGGVETAYFDKSRLEDEVCGIIDIFCASAFVFTSPQTLDPVLESGGLLILNPQTLDPVLESCVRYRASLRCRDDLGQGPNRAQNVNKDQSPVTNNQSPVTLNLLNPPPSTLISRCSSHT
jgi:pimeloyl-ACP methyl ester carboxylesterase